MYFDFLLRLQVVALEHYRIISVACGAYHNAAITYNGLLFTWGCNSNGQLGREGDDTGVKLVRALSDHKVVQVGFYVYNLLFLTTYYTVSLEPCTNVYKF